MKKYISLNLKLNVSSCQFNNLRFCNKIGYIKNPSFKLHYQFKKILSNKYYYIIALYIIYYRRIIFKNISEYNKILRLKCWNLNYINKEINMANF